MSKVNFKCKKCRTIFDGDVGKITFPRDILKGGKPIYEKDVECTYCGVLTLDTVDLTELGKHQLLDSLELNYFENTV